jgi:UDP-N-acetylglucosamine--dolichyl-phosphate N-acetylglucosaminephosphotransferase
MSVIAALFVVVALLSWLSAKVMIPHLRRAGIAGQDVNKPGRPETPEMGGLGITLGFSSGVLIVLALTAFFHLLPGADPVLLLAALSTVLLAGFIGTLDDLLGMRQGLKAFLPIVAALPLMAVRAGDTSMTIPLLGVHEFWIVYPLVLVPVGVTVAANAVNMLAGFNGLEVGLGLVAMGSLAVIAALLKETTALVLLLSGAGALAGILRYNWYPARVFVGDVGTLSIGAVLAASCVVGNFEMAGVIVLIPYAVDFTFKARHGFPSTGWRGELGPDGKLRCPTDRPVSLCQFIMKLTGGIHERSLVLLLMGIEAVFGLLAIALYVWS